MCLKPKKTVCHIVDVYCMAACKKLFIPSGGDRNPAALVTSLAIGFRLSSQNHRSICPDTISHCSFIQIVSVDPVRGPRMEFRPQDWENLIYLVLHLFFRKWGGVRSTCLQTGMLRSWGRRDSWLCPALFHSSQTSLSQEPQGSSMDYHSLAASQNKAQDNHFFTRKGIVDISLFGFQVLLHFWSHQPWSEHKPRIGRAIHC